MACFVAPAAVAVVTTIVQKVVEKKETKEGLATERHPVRSTYAWSQRLRWLNTMLWGGTILLALEHVWHGEVVPWPPFLTAIETPGAVGPMLREIVTHGVTMTAVVIVAWAAMVVVAERRSRTKSPVHAQANTRSGGA